MDGWSKGKQGWKLGGTFLPCIIILLDWAGSEGGSGMGKERPGKLGAGRAELDTADRLSNHRVLYSTSLRLCQLSIRKTGGLEGGAFEFQHIFQQRSLDGGP